MLVRRYGMPFRTAHSVIGRAVQKGTVDLATIDEAAVEITGKPLSRDGLTQNDIEEALQVSKSVASRDAPGGPSAMAVRVALAERRALIDKDRAELDGRISAISEAVTRLINDARRMTA